MVTIPEDADPSQVKAGEAKHGSDEDQQMATISDIPAIEEGESA
jgi:hypothetical protein